MNPIKRKKRFILHLSSVVRKLAADLGIDPSDKNYVLRRLHHEGFKFLSKILPQFSKYALSCVEAMRILNASTYGITCFDTKAGAPIFMIGLLKKAVTEKCAVSLYQIRQFCDYFYKLALSFDNAELEKAEQKFLHNDRAYEETIDWGWVEKGRKAFEVLFPKLLRITTADVLSRHRPHDGPGAYASSESLSGAGLVPAAIKRYHPAYERLKPLVLKGELTDNGDFPKRIDKALRAFTGGEVHIDNIKRWFNGEYSVGGYTIVSRFSLQSIARPSLRRVRLLRKIPKNGKKPISNKRVLSVYKLRKRPYERYRFTIEVLAGRIGSHLSKFEHLSGFFKPYPSFKRRYGEHGNNERFLMQNRDPLFTGACNEVIFVPKDSRGPRVISKEPFHLIRVQLGLAKGLAEILERESHGSINFVDQTVNQQVAFDGSVSRNWATGDLRDASDRVSFRGVSALLRNAPWWKDVIRSRTTHSILPSGNRVALKKFANMGNGLCFPILALYVHIAVVLGVCQWRFGTTKSLKHLVWASRRVRVYGDDAAFPSESISYVKASLIKFGLAINDSKTFWRGYFRESCGKDYYFGNDVTPVRLRLSGAALETPNKYRNGSIPIGNDAGILQVERHCRELMDKGMYTLASYYYTQLAYRLGPLPRVSKTSSTLGVYDPHNVLTRRCDYPVLYHPDLPEQPVVRTGDVSEAFYDEEVGDYYLNPISPLGTRRLTRVFQPLTEKLTDISVSEEKGLGISLKSRSSDGDDYSVIPLRRKVYLKKRVPVLADLLGYGLTSDPACLIG